MGSDGGESGGGRGRGRRWAVVAVLAVIVFAIGALLREVASGGDGGGKPAAELLTSVRAKLAAEHPQAAARLALRSAPASLSPEAQLAMVNVATEGAGIERVVDTGSDVVTAVALLERQLVTADGDGTIRVWRRADGAPLGETEAPRPLAALTSADSSSPFLAAVDASGAMLLLDVSDPGQPRLRALGPRLAPGEEALAVAFSEQALQVVAVGSGGEVLRVDQTDGAVAGRDSLAAFRGRLPWSGSAPRLTVARFAPEIFNDEEGLLVGTKDGAVADVDLLRGQGKTVLDAGIAPGRLLDVDRDPYGETLMTVGTSGGLVVEREPEDAYGGGPEVEHGPAVTAVALDPTSGYWTGGSEGFALPDSDLLPVGPPVSAVSRGAHGMAAIDAGGLVSILGPAETGLSMAATEETAVARFDPRGRLLVASGYDPNHVEEIRAVRPQPPPLGDSYQEAQVPQTYRPDPGWWPDADDPQALYINDVAADDKFVAAAGQDPEGEAAVMVWDAASGEPLQHLPLGTGGVSTSLPSIASRVILLPEQQLLVAFSPVQELLAVFSTETWELEDAVPVGAAGGIATTEDGSSVVLVGLADEPEFSPTWREPVELRFVDPAAAEVDHTVELPGAVEAALSPGGETLAVADSGGHLRFRSADGLERRGRPVDLGTEVKSLAWSPDGELLAAALGYDGVVLVDPASGEVSERLPDASAGTALGLSWSPNGELLAALRGEPDEDGEGYDPKPATIWSLGDESLRRRMCQLAACAPAAGRLPALPGGALEDASRLRGVDLVFRRDGDLLAADRDGATVRIGGMEESPSPTPAYDWSERGLAWSAPGRVSVLITGEKRPRSWACACSGVAWDGDRVLSVTRDGAVLVRIDPGQGDLATTPIHGLKPFDPTLLGIVGGIPVAAAYEREPDRSTFSSLFKIGADGAATRLPRNAHGSIYRTWPSSSDDTLAFVAGFSSGVCYSTANVGLVRIGDGGELELEFPEPPLGEEPVSVRSAQVAADGTVSAAVGRLGCDNDGLIEDREPLAQRYLLAGGGWRTTGETGFDVQAIAGGGTAVVARSTNRGYPGALSLRGSSGSEPLAPVGEGMVARP